MRAEMINALVLSYLRAALLVMIGVVFGVLVARAIWAEDLQRTRNLQETWDRTKQSYRGIISSQERTIDAQEKTIVILKLRLGEP